MHPTTKKMIAANTGRFGPYVVHDGEYRSLKKEDNVYTVTLERAVELLAMEKKGRGGANLIRELGPHPKDQKMVAIYEGKYGPYVKYGSKNASLAKDSDPQKLTLEEGLALLAARSPKKGK
jgi:DNA topoisomerase-1